MHLRATIPIVQRVGRVEIHGRGILVVGAGGQPFVERPAEVLSADGVDVDVFPIAPADVADVQHAWVAVDRQVASTSGPQLHAVRVSVAQGPDAGARRPRQERVVVGIARHAVARGRVDADDLAGHGIDQLRAEGADVFLGRDDSAGQRLRSVVASDIASGIDRAVARSVAGGGQ